MFGFSWSEILIIGVVALVLIGPNDLPRAMKTAARWMSAGRKLAREFQGHVDDLVREAELDELREQARKLAMQPLSGHIQNAIDPRRELADALSPPTELRGPVLPATPASPPAVTVPLEPSHGSVPSLVEAPPPEAPAPAELLQLDPDAPTAEPNSPP
jgi:sec-independent protein translocase protein TatB